MSAKQTVDPVCSATSHCSGSLKRRNRPNASLRAEADAKLIKLEAPNASLQQQLYEAHQAHASLKAEADAGKTNLEDALKDAASLRNQGQSLTAQLHQRSKEVASVQEGPRQRPPLP